MAIDPQFVPPFAPEFVLTILLAGALIGGIITGAAGFGSGPVVMGIWLLVLEPTVAAPLLMANALIYVPASLRTVWHAVRVKRVLPFVAGAAIGAPIGTWFLTRVDPAGLKLGIGVFLIIYCAVQLARVAHITIKPKSWRPDVGIGVLGGFVGGAAAMPGVIWTLWTGMRGWTKDEQRAVYQPLNIATVAFSFLSFTAGGLVTKEVGMLTLWVLPTTLIGVACGVPLYRHISETAFRKLILTILFGIGMMLVGGALW